jgi:hypothetical protein
VDDFTTLPPQRITSPEASTASTPSTWWRVTPYFTARMPPALVPTFPPRLALYSPGNTGYTSPSGASSASSCSSRTPGSTVTMKFSRSISTMAPMRSNDTTIPPSTGMQAPDNPVPDPRAVTGTLCRPATRSTAATSAVVPGSTTAAGFTGVAVSASSCV